MMASPIPKIVMVPHEDSHPFARKECIVNEPLRVGRWGKVESSSDLNFLYCLRVSRNHALISFEKGKVSQLAGDTVWRYCSATLDYTLNFANASAIICFYVNFYTCVNDY